MVGFCHFFVFQCLSERYYKIQLLLITLYIELTLPLSLKQFLKIQTQVDLLLTRKANRWGREAAIIVAADLSSP